MSLILMFLIFFTGCSEKNTCLDTEYFSAADQDCQLLSTCSEGTYEAIPASSNKDRTCQAVTNCLPGEYVVLEATDKTDRVCKACVIGDNYSITENSPDCIPVSDCGYDEYPSTTPTLTSDLTCENCEATVLIENGTCSTCSDALTCLSASCLQGYRDEDGTCILVLPPENSQCNLDEQEQEINCACDNGFFGVLGWDEVNMTWDGQCQPWKQCLQGQYVRVEGTNLSDRECENCIQDTSFSNTINAAECTSVTDCNPGQVVLNPPTPYADRTCLPCVQGTSYSSTTNATECTPVTDCNPGQAVDISPTPTTDRTCLPCIQDSSFSSTTNATECVPVADCSPGQAVLNPPTPYADRTCLPCIQDSSFSNTYNAIECTPVTDCNPGQAVDVPPTLTADRMCEPCEQDVSFSTSINASECTLVTDCSPGEAVLNPPTPYADRTCLPCIQDTSFSVSVNADECSLLTDCYPGQAELDAPSITTDRTCESCLQDVSFSTSINADECFPVTDCNPGQAVLNPPTPYANRTCLSCIQDSSFSTSVNAEECTPLTNCVPGQVILDQPTLGSDRTCEPCVQSSSYSSIMNATVCTPVTDCDPGQAALYPPTQYADRLCESCVQDASFSNTRYASECIALTTCVPGQGVLDAPTLTSDRTCEPCIQDTSFSTIENASECTPVTDCTPGQEVLDLPSPLSDRTCQTCVQNTSFSNIVNATECQIVEACADNEYESLLPTLINDRECDVLYIGILTTDSEAHESGTDPATFQITITEALQQDLNIEFSLSGSAVEGIDFELYESGNLVSGDLLIAAGQTEIDVHVVPLVTPDIEATEWVALTLETSLHYERDNPHTATVSIVEYGPSTGNVYYVDTTGDDANIGDESNPFATIGFAVDQLSAGDTLYIKDGVYTNNGFVDDHGPDGEDNISNPLLASIDVSGTSDNWIKIAAYPDGNTIRPLLNFDGSGGIEIVSGSQYILIEGLEIQGPNASIVDEWAYNHRWSKENFYKGRGIFSWGPVDHIAVKNCDVHHTPGSGIRFNKSDYILVENNTVSNTTWWSSSAESAIVIATAESIDTQDAVKFLYIGNVVYNNWNFLEFCNSQYEGSTDDVYGNCDHYTGGIIDGQGLYVTRNKDTYLYGRMRFENNIAFNNGFGGVVYHKTNRGELLNNLVFMNGAYPGLSNYTGLTVNTADDLTIRNNIVWAREFDDYAIKNNGNATNVTTDHNYVVGTAQFGSNSDNTFIDFNSAEDFALLFVNAADISMAHPDPALTTGDFSPSNIDDYVQNFDLDFRPVSTANSIINAGSMDLAPSTDMDGNSRPQGGEVDIGPYEHP